ncbi:MAG: dihydroorotate dehydrogenase [Planctomycetes bacterium]|nr:dihydroorotate dehydrogenase [Planctomycetota bacterium]
MVDLRVNIAGVELANPIMTASGTCGYATEYADFVDLTQLGAFVTKSITPAPRVGNPPDRIVETRAGMLNAIGLANVGLQRFLDEKIPELETLGLPVFVNVAGAYLEDYITVTEALADVPIVRGIELNISCPNVKEGGIAFGVDPRQVKLVTEAVKAVCGKNILIVKLSPNVTDIAETAAAAVEGGADALSLINTFTAMAIDVEKRRPLLANNTGGLSGPAIHPVAVYMVHRVYTRVARPAGVPLIAMGGVQYWRDAVEFLLAGATGVAVGAALFADPRCLLALRDGIAAYLDRQGAASVTDIIGTLRLN